MSERKVRQACAHASGSTVRRTRRTSRPALVPTVRARPSLRSTSMIPTRIATATAMLSSSSHRRPGGCPVARSSANPTAGAENRTT